MLMYAEFLKQISLKKREANEHETIALGEERSVMVLNKLLTKFKDLCSFSTSYLIGNISISRALCDISSSVSLMPYLIFKKLDLGELKLANIFLQ